MRLLGIAFFYFSIRLQNPKTQNRHTIQSKSLFSNPHKAYEHLLGELLKSSQKHDIINSKRFNENFEGGYIYDQI